MTGTGISSFILGLLLLVTPTSASVCPKSCVCTTTRDSLHRAACSDVAELYKHTLRQKHHNINILDLSHNNITKLTHELDRLTEIVTLDLSTNGLQEVNKFLTNSKKLVHLTLSNNRIKKLSLSTLPTSVSSIDITYNLLRDVPSDIGHLVGLEHLELEGNPLNCSCENILARDHLLSSNVLIDNVMCFTPLKLKGQSWLKLKAKDICETTKHSFEDNYLDMMMGDEPIDAVKVGLQTTELKSMPLVALNDLDEGTIVDGSKTKDEDDDSVTFLQANTPRSSSIDIEGSGDMEMTTVSEFMVKESRTLDQDSLEQDYIIPATDHTTEDPIEGSGQEGSGFGWVDIHENEFDAETTTALPGPLYTGPIQPFFATESTLRTDTSNSTEYPTPQPVTIFMGGKDWIMGRSDAVTEKAVPAQITRDTTVSEQIRITQAVEITDQSAINDKPAPHKTGTYVCIAIIVVLLVGLIGFAIVKGQMRKRRDRRLLRQQKTDVERASKEMIDMNKSLLGKPALVDNPVDKKSNGKYELVPTHEPYTKKGENGELSNGLKRKENSENQKDESPRDTNQNKNSSRDNNLNDSALPAIQLETSFDSTLTSPDSKKDSNSLSSEDIFVPINGDDSLRLNGMPESDISQPLLNGDQNTDSDFLSPNTKYVPVYPQDMNRVRIKMSEIPKPKTPVLVTRSRSNAGDIIITPSDDTNDLKSIT